MQTNTCEFRKAVNLAYGQGGLKLEINIPPQHILAKSKGGGGGLYSKGVSLSEYGICSVRIISLYPVVQLDAGYTTGHPVVQPVALMHNLSRPQLPGCATGQSENYPVVQPGKLKASS